MQQLRLQLDEKLSEIPKPVPITFGSLFAGIGGFDLGLERAGMVCKWQVENDKYARRVLDKNWPDVRKHDDIRTFAYDWDDGWRVDVVAAGFPCQDISRSGKRAGIKGSKSGLVTEVFRVARQLRPRCLVLENVTDLRSSGLHIVLKEMASIGYDSEWHCIPAGRIGAPHIRDRIFIIGILSDPDSEFGQSREKQWRSAENAWRSSGSNEFRQWDTEPLVGRVADGVPNWTHRLRCLGNAVVPQVAEVVGHRIVKMLAFSV